MGDPGRPLLILMGLRRSGKSSIQRVVFHKMSPNETLFLESTSRIGRMDVASFTDFELWDFPGHADAFDRSFDAEAVYKRCGVLVFVLDAQDDYMESLARLFMIVTAAYRINPKIAFEVFIHKVDGLSEDQKIDTQRDIHQRITDELGDAGFENVQLSFYLTTIYDHSIFEAFSKVIQKLIVELPTLENLLNNLCSSSNIEKAFLFDVVSKIYIATDSSPVDVQSYELCSDMIDVALDVSSIYSRDASFENVESVFDGESGSTIRLSSGMVLHLRQVGRHLAVVALLRDGRFESQALLDYNFRLLKGRASILASPRAFDRYPT
ncbi:ras-related GTP binding D [Hyaloraphidium curvatum]|nr:ras-related GTP binding D [Hyaloraphidium curvatum]